MITSFAPGPDRSSSRTETALVGCAHITLLSPTGHAGGAHARSAGLPAALRNACDQFIAIGETTVQFLDQLGKGMVGDPSLDSHRLEGRIRKQLPHNLSIKFGAMIFR